MKRCPGWDKQKEKAEEEGGTKKGLKSKLDQVQINTMTNASRKCRIMTNVCRARHPKQSGETILPIMCVEEKGRSK
jgi:hypothetical protein